MDFVKKSCFILLYIMIGINIGYGEIREDFHSNEPDKQHLLSVIKDTQYNESTISLAYLGLCEAMMAEHLFLPTSKIGSFNKGKQKVEQAIKNDPENLELRYIRLLIQLNSPKIVNYFTNIPGDLEYFVENLNQQISDKQWRMIFVNNLLAAKNLSKDQENQLLSLKQGNHAAGTRRASR